MTQTFILGFPNRMDDAPTVSGGSWLAAAPVTNVGTWPLAETARSSDATTASTKIQVDHGAAVTARALILMRHNLSSAATVTWKRGTTAGASDVVSSGAIAAWRFTPRAYDGAVYDAQVLLGAEYSARYDTIEIDDTANTDGYVEVGRLMICPVFEPTYNPSFGLRDGHVEYSTKARTQNGADWVTPRRRLREVQFALNWLTLAEGRTLHEMQQMEGTTSEVVYLPYSDTPGDMQRFGLVGTLRELSGVEYPQTQTRGVGFAIDQRG